jgi:hypothetical protein
MEASTPKWPVMRGDERAIWMREPKIRAENLKIGQAY